MNKVDAPLVYKALDAATDAEWNKLVMALQRGMANSAGQQLLRMVDDYLRLIDSRLGD